MAQDRFHRTVEYRLYRRGDSEPRAWLEFYLGYKHATFAKYRRDPVLLFWLKHGVQQNYLHDVVYEIAGPAGSRTSVKYVDRQVDDDRTLLVFRKLRRRARAVR